MSLGRGKKALGGGDKGLLLFLLKVCDLLLLLSESLLELLDLFGLLQIQYRDDKHSKC